MSFSRDSRFRSENGLKPGVPSSQDYQTTGEPMISPNRYSLSGTTFGASSRPVLSDTNQTIQGKLVGFATHRVSGSQSPRPGPGAHSRETPGVPIDKYGRGVWLESRSPVKLEEERLKAKINFFNLRIAGELGFETTNPQKLKQRRNELCRTVKSIGSLNGSRRASFTYNFDDSTFMTSTLDEHSAKRCVPATAVATEKAPRKIATARPQTALS